MIFFTDKLQEKTDNLYQLVKFVKRTHAEHLQGYNGYDVSVILYMLQNSPNWENSSHSTGNGDPSSAEGSLAPNIKVKSNNYSTNTGNRLNYSNMDASNTSNGYINAYPSGGNTNYVQEDKVDTLHEVAHGLHFASIAILGFIVCEVSYFNMAFRVFV